MLATFSILHGLSLGYSPDVFSTLGDLMKNVQYGINISVYSFHRTHHQYDDQEVGKVSVQMEHTFSAGNK